MANAPIQKPRLFQAPGAAWPGRQRTAQTDGSNSFEAGVFVVLTSGALVAMASGGIAIFGLTQDPSHAATDEPYTAPFGEKHNVIDPSGGALFIMNLTDGSGTEGSGTTTQASAAIGTRYAMIYGATSTTTAMVNLADSGTATKNNLQVVALYNAATFGTGDASGDFNGRVIVKIVESQIQ